MVSIFGQMNTRAADYQLYKDKQDNLILVSGNFEIILDEEVHYTLDGEELHDTMGAYMIDPNGSTELVIPDGFGINALRGGIDSRTTSVKVLAKVKYLYDAFQDGYNLQSVELPNTLKEIGIYAFCNCYKLKNITIPSSVTKIWGDAFLDCDSLTSITIPGTVQSIGYRAIASCDKLKTVTVESGVKTIDVEAFADDPLLTKVQIPSSVTTLGSSHGFVSVIYNSPKAAIYTPLNSKAYKYAKQLDLPVKVAANVPSTPNALSGLKASSNKTSSVKLSWAKSTNANSYTIYQYKSKKWTQIATTTSNSYTVNKLASGTSYQFKVTPVNKQSSASKSGTAASVTTYTKNDAPTIKSVAKKSAISVKITFAQDKTAKNYEVYVSSDGKTYTLATTISNTSKGLKTYTLTAASVKYVKMRAYSTFNNATVYSAYSKAVKVK